MQNFIIFADKAHDKVTSKDLREDHQLILRNGEPMLFGKDQQKGLHLNGTHLEIVTLGEQGITEKDILIHNPFENDSSLHLKIAQMTLPDFPVALGVIRSVAASTYDDLLQDQINNAKDKGNIRSVDDLLNSGDIFTIG